MPRTPTCSTFGITMVCVKLLLEKSALGPASSGSGIPLPQFTSLPTDAPMLRSDALPRCLPRPFRELLPSAWQASDPASWVVASGCQKSPYTVHTNFSHAVPSRGLLCYRTNLSFIETRVDQFLRDRNLLAESGSSRCACCCDQRLASTGSSLTIFSLE